MRGWRLVYAGLTAAILLWLMRTPSPPSYSDGGDHHSSPPIELATSHDPDRCGTVSGRVRWDGPIPSADSLTVPHFPNMPQGLEHVPNPNLPRVEQGGILDAVLLLRSVDLTRSRAWDHPPVEIEVTHPDFVVHQGGRPGRIGIVRRADEVQFVSRGPGMHSARARGAEFFTQMLPVPDRRVRRRLQHSGVVELSSGTGYYWMRSYLFVSDHPYVCRTDADGRFQLEGVPDGEYELVCWHANWNIDRLERDPELVVPVRLHFRPAIEQVQRIRVLAGQTVVTSFTLSSADFAGTE